QELAGARRLAVHGSVEHDAHALGVAAVRRHLAVGVEDDGVDHVGLTRDAGDVLLERRVVVEEERPVGDRGEVPGEDLAPALHLLDDRRALPVLHHDHDRRHDEPDHEQRAPEEFGLEGPESHRARSNQTLRSGMYGSPSPLTSTLRTYGWKSRS